MSGALSLEVELFSFAKWGPFFLPFGIESANNLGFMLLFCFLCVVNLGHTL